MNLELILCLILSILPLFYNVNLGIFLYEKGNHLTDLWKNKIFSFWFPIVLVLFFLSFVLFFDPKLEIVFFPIFFYFLAIYNVYVLWKIFRGRLEKALNKKHVFLLLLFIWLDIFLILYFFSTIYLYPYILFIFLLNSILFFLLWIKKNNWNNI